jgi:hypothetical protein
MNRISPVGRLAGGKESMRSARLQRPRSTLIHNLLHEFEAREPWRTLRALMRTLSNIVYRALLAEATSSSVVLREAV